MGLVINMNDTKMEIELNEDSFRNQHRFMLFITISLLISIVIISISMFMYNISGAAQLDLSRPGYNSVRSMTTIDDGDFHTFSSNGTLKSGDIIYFKSLFKKQAQKVKVVDAFGGDSLNPEALGISTPTDEQP